MPGVTYPLDTTGRAISNLVPDEICAITATAGTQKASIYIPASAPFYKDQTEIWTGIGRTGTKLTEFVDFVWCFEAVTLTLLNGNGVLYGGIQFLDRTRSDTVYITYQTIGGIYTLSDVSIFTSAFGLANQVSYYTWDMVTGKPGSYTPAYHYHQESDQTMQTVTDKLAQILSAIVALPAGPV